jgi:hypothetical protein
MFKNLLKPKMKSLTTMLSLGLVSASLTAADITITDSGFGTGTTTWTADNNYLLDGMVFINSGDTLTIEPGTVIKGKSGTGSAAAALIVARGGYIHAEGTAQNPIVFTFEGDPLTGVVPTTTRGEWGGIIVLGDAQLNSSPGESAIEGIPTSEARGLYGGLNDEDNSGVLKYISIRHGGTDIGAGNEINGLTFGGVGSGTTVDFIEVIANADDGLEFFGGTVGVKHAIISFCGDDSFDYDEGFRGRGQYWVTVQDPDAGDRGGEHDGGTDPETGTPYAHPMIYNATYIGRGQAAGKRAITFRDNAAGEYHNSIFANWAKGIDIENLASGEDSYSRFDNGELVLEGNVFYDVVSNGVATASDIFKVSLGSGAIDAGEEAAFQASFSANGNESGDPGISYASISTGGGLSLVPTTALASEGATSASDNWFDPVVYKGAFAPETAHWAEEWTLFSQAGYLDNFVGIEDQKSIVSLVVHPNPSSGNFQIDLSPLNENKVEVIVFNVLGSVVSSATFQTTTANIDLTNQSNGIYMIKVISENSEAFIKVIKN